MEVDCKTVLWKDELDNRPVTSRSVGRSHGIDGDYLGQVYKDHLSDYEHWDQKVHAKEWILMAKNMGRHLSIGETMYCGKLYTFVSNKDARGGRGTIIAIIAGVKAETVLRWLLEIPEEERRGVLDVSMDFLRRSFYTLRTCPDKWSGEQWERMNILFEEFPELKEAFDLKEEFRKLYWSKRDKEELKDKMPAPEERNAFKETVGENLHAWYGHVKKSKSPGMKTFMRTIKEREGNLLNYYETFVTNASAESLNSGIKGFRAELHGISNLPFFFYRVCKIYG